MDELEIRGGRRLKGTVRVSGSKNAALPCLFATLLTREPCTLSNVPWLDDIRTAVRLLTTLGKSVEPAGGTLRIGPETGLRTEAPYDLVRRMRASVLVLGPLLARKGRARVSFPGGCAIGARPINFHLEGLRRLGARIRIEEGYIEAAAPKGLRAARLQLPFPSVGATEHLMMAAALARGVTVIEGAAREPEITDLGRFLDRMGLVLEGHGTDRIIIQGADSLSGARHEVIPDRIEAGTLLIAAAITRGEIRLEGARADHLDSLLDKLERAGVKLRVSDGSIKAAASGRLKPVALKTSGYPGFPTDLQAQWTAFMATVPGLSAVCETIFESRVLHVQELQRLGAAVTQKGKTTWIQGGRPLSGGPVMVSDLRAGAALVLAGLAARGKTRVLRIYHLDRGYEKLERKLASLGATIRRVHR